MLYVKDLVDEPGVALVSTSHAVTETASPLLANNILELQKRPELATALPTGMAEIA